MQTLHHRTDIELIADYRRDGDRAAREELVMRHAGLVRSIARRYRGRGLAHDDILQTGFLGLIQAVDRFEPERGVPLRAYAARTIEGEIMHLFRDRGWAVRVPRSLQDMSRRVAGVRDRLGHLLGRTPTLPEIAEAMGEPEDSVAEAIAAQRAYTAEPLAEANRPEGGSDERPHTDSSLAFEDDGFDAVEKRDVLARAMRTLPTRERRIVALRVYQDLTQSEIAARTGISQMHVSRLLRRSLRTLRGEIERAQAA
jgi:RNA polymerase sigma-B factor